MADVWHPSRDQCPGDYAFRQPPNTQRAATLVTLSRPMLSTPLPLGLMLYLVDDRCCARFAAFRFRPCCSACSLMALRPSAQGIGNSSSGRSSKRYKLAARLPRSLSIWRALHIIFVVGLSNVSPAVLTVSRVANPCAPDIFAFWVP